MNNKKQTAVEWLAEKMMHPSIYNTYIDEAKMIEKEQIIFSYNQGYRDAESDSSNIPLSIGDISEFNNAKNYYKENYE